MTTLFSTIKKQILSQDLGIASQDLERPWGGFFVIDEKDAQLFADIYFDGHDVDSLRKAGKLSPKILLVKPAARLSWQYHHRRAETWRVIQGPVGVVRSFDDTQNQPVVCEQETVVTLQKAERHRLIGLEGWGVVAEFWQHTDPNNPSNEDDIVRLQDDYARQ